MFVLCSHERSGSNLALNLLNFNVPGGIARFDEGRNVPTHTGSGGVCFKTHELANEFPDWMNKLPVLYVMRDPRDVLVSSFYYWKSDAYELANRQVIRTNRMSIFLGQKMPSLFRRSGAITFPDRVCQHIKHGTADERTVCVVRYSDLVCDPKRAVRMMAERLGLKLKKGFVPCGLGEGVVVEPRRGTVGDWRNHMTTDDAEEVLGKMYWWFDCPALYLES